MAPPTTFFRLLKTPIDQKGAALADRIADLNATGAAEETYTLDPAAFAQIPGSPFAYWVSRSIRDKFQTLASFEPRWGEVRAGLQSLGADDTFIRAWWEVPNEYIGRDARWVAFAKGGESRTWFSDVYLVTDWENGGERQKAFAIRKYASVTRKIVGLSHYFRPGLTYTAYTNRGFHVRTLPADCIFSLAGSGIFLNSEADLYWTLGILNSSLLEYCLRLMTDRRKWEPGYVKLLPFTQPSPVIAQDLQTLVQQCIEISRDDNRSDETTHAFCLPGLTAHHGGSLLEASLALEAGEQARAARLAAIQAQIDDLVFDLYGLDEPERTLIRSEMGGSHRDTEGTEEDENLRDLCASVANKSGGSHRDTEGTEKNLRDLCASVAEDTDEPPLPPESLSDRVQNLLQWCVGVAFGRWDARFALDPALLPPLGGPFDPLPRCAPGALVGADGLPPADPAAVRALAYPLPLPWDGILVDDPTHPSDLVARVRQVLALLWGERAGAIEREACQVLGLRELRDYFRDPRRFFAFHVKRYSKSRRKAPIYWLLQSERRGYGIWLYIHRMRRDVLYAAGRDYVDVKIKLEQGNLDDLCAGRQALQGAALKRREQEIARQERLVAEIAAFGKKLDQIALLNLAPDLNDGVLISIAPLWELTPWKEAARTWDSLVAGEYPWSHMAGLMREKGLALTT